MEHVLLKIVVATFLVIVAFLNQCFAYQVNTEKDAVAYLTHYGYVDPKVMPKGFTLKDCNKKLKEFQKLARVDVTGIFDNSTMKAMNEPRCGCPDFIQLSFKDSGSNSVEQDDDHNHQHAHNRNRSATHHHRFHQHHHHHAHGNRTTRHSRTRFDGRRTKRYVLSERQWEKRVVTYNIVQYPSRHDIKLSTREIDDTIHKAFQIWGQHIKLEFGYRPNAIDADIEISFASRYHGDSYPFDGPGITLAHAFFPGSGLGGDVHFEEDENWTLGSYTGVNLLYVAVHELGHSLGLGHSSDYGAIMYPMYLGYTPNLQLHTDDIRGVQALYGRPAPGSSTTSTTTTPRTTTRSTATYKPRTNGTTTNTIRPGAGSGNNYLCKNPSIDAITTIFDDTILVFQGTLVYEISENGDGVVVGVDVSSYFRGLEGDFDCVITRSNGKTYFFKGRKYWRFTGTKMDRGYPRYISEYFPGIPDYLDAVFEWDEEFVFVKGSKFWRFNTRQRPQVQPFFPMPINHWGLSQGINAAFTAPDRNVYFFQGSYFWRFDKESHKVTQNLTTSVSAERWFGCWEP